MLTISTTLVSRELRRRRVRPFREVHEEARREAPIDGVEVVEWMQKCGAINRICSPWFNDYTDAGGAIEGMANDGWYPGCFTTTYQVFARQTGDAVREDGYVRVDNRYGEEVARVPPFQRAFFDRLRGLVIETDLYSVQHNTLLAEIRRKISLPFRGEMRLGAINVAEVGYLSVPGVFRAKFLRPTKRMILRVGYEAATPGTLKVQVYSEGVLIDTGEIPSDAGNYTALVRVRSDRLIPRTPDIVVAYDGSETGINLYEVSTVFPVSIPI